MHDMIRGLVRGLRSLARTPIFTLTMTGTLALGIGGTTAAFSPVHSVMLRPLPYPEASELVRIANQVQARDWGSSAADYLALKEQQTLFHGVAAVEWRNATFVSDAKTERILVHSATPGLLPLLGVSTAYGRTFTEEEGLPGTPTVALVSWGFWNRELGGDPTAVGGSIRLDGVEVPVVGIFPRDWGPLLEDVEVLVPLELEPPTRKGPFFLEVFGRLAEGAGAGLALAVLGIRLAAASGSTFFPRTGEVGLTGPVLVFFAVASAASLVLFGLLPALRGSRPQFTL
jgi:hypothetical protein